MQLILLTRSMKLELLQIQYLTVPGAHFNAESVSTEAGANDFETIDLPFTGQTVTLTAYP